MAKSARAGKISEAIRRELEIATALGRETLWIIHTDYALELIEHAHPEVSPTRALGIYLRLHGIPDDEAEILTHRVLVTLGDRRGEHRPDGRTVTASGITEAAPEEPASLARRLQKRLRGRVNPELRRWVELQTGRAEVALLKAHVENAMRFVEILKPESSYAATIQLYTEMIGVSRSLAEMIYFFTLDRLSRSPLSTVSQGGAHPALPAHAPKESLLRIVESNG